MEKQTNKKYLGFSLGYDSSACLLDSNDNILKAISEERLTRIKNDKHFPMKAINFCLQDIDKKDIEKVCYSNYERDSLETILERSYFSLDEVKTIFNKTNNFDKFLKLLFKEKFDLDTSFHRTEHHQAHSIGSYVCSGFNDDALLITSDGFGDGFSSTLNIIENGRIKRIEQFSNTSKNSIGLVYQYTTRALGYKMHRDEWKLLGNEPKGNNKNERYYGFFRNLISYDFSTHKIKVNIENFKQDKTKNKSIDDFDFMLSLQDYISKNINLKEKNDVSACLQRRIEEVACDWVGDITKYFGNKPLCLSGGVFMNVKLNNKLYDLNKNQPIYVLPFAGDLGTCIGSCYDYLFKDKPIETKKLTSLFLGTDIKDDVEKSFLEFNIKLKKVDDIANEVSSILSQNKLINICLGKSEFGPRALMNRSTLYTAEFTDVNEWLNEACNRDKIMPYAPVTIEDFENDLFLNAKNAEDSTRNMTITLIATNEYKKNYPATSHKIINEDSMSARPQIVKIGDNPLAWDIIRKYHEKTGRKAIVNTSFNVHNSPIVNTTRDAIRTFIYMGVKDSYLLVENNLISYEENKQNFDKLRETIRKEDFV